MTSAPTAFQGEQLTFRELFDRYALVEIPIIQRDYAQGRKSVSEIRKDFLAALCRALKKDDATASAPLDLDFVYGSVVEPKETSPLNGSGRAKRFQPLDGQQRLTTLFLMHWYLAWKDGAVDDFTSFIRNPQNSTSRFSYSVRSSSKEFFDFLVSYFPGEGLCNYSTLSNNIADQPGFFSSWNLDPSVKSALAMLDEIDGLFGSEQGLYERLVRVDRPFITFQLLDLGGFPRSDDLYIKMNARGKQLTPFETFKARLEQKLADIFVNQTTLLHGKPVTKKEYFSRRIDTVWSDLFWNYRQEETNLFDDRILNLIHALIVVTRSPDDQNTESFFKTVFVEKETYSFSAYDELHAIDIPFVETLIAMLDAWCGAANGIKTHLPSEAYYDERATFQAVIEGTAGYTELVGFHAYCAYLRKHQNDAASGPFGEWMRVVANLAENTLYNSQKDFANSIRAVNGLLDDSAKILNCLASPRLQLRGFDEQQMREEKLKAQLIQKSFAWREAILMAEQHEYFVGRIEFLFVFSGVMDRWLKDYSSAWSDTEDGTFLANFKTYCTKAAAVFAAHNSGELDEFQFERALLAMGDYLLETSSNHCFLSYTDHRDTSWRRLLKGAIDPDDPVSTKRGYFKELLDRIDLTAGVKTSLECVIRDARADVAWRQAIIENPKLIEYCGQRMIRHKDQKVYLFNGRKMGKWRVELFTYDLWKGLFANLQNQGALSPFSEAQYYYEEPCTYLEYNCDAGTVVLDAMGEWDNYQIEVYVRPKPGEEKSGVLPSKLRKAMLLKTTSPIEKDEAVSWTVNRENIEDRIREIAGAVRNYDVDHN